ncbi:MAG: radical SAM protein [Deltaproteobacteria bacterium]|nr:radical SAM protein [Deltaproteobacteria bacterium]
MKYAQPDYGIIGEGDYSMLSLVEKLGSDESLEGIPGLVKNYSETKTKKNNYSIVSQLSNIGAGACDVVTDFRMHYYEPGGFVPIQTKRGCALNCIYCTTPFMEGKKYRFRPISHIIEEIKSYQDYWDVKYFFFVDATFNHPLEWAMEICNAILEAGLKIKWFSEITPLSITDELCKLMAKSGCLALTLTPDSCSDTVLKTYDKPFGMGEVITAIKLLKKYNLLFDTDIIIGGPGETMDTFSATMSFCSENLHKTPVSFYDGMIINSNTPAYDIAVKEGVVDGSKIYEDVVLKNDFKEMKKYEYLFPHLLHGRKEFIKRIKKINLGKRWRITSLDFAPDPKTGEFAANSNILLDSKIRPWAGWTRKGDS